MAYKQLLNYSEENLIYDGNSQINNDWFLRQLKSFLCSEDYENFVNKNITIEDLNENTLFVAKFMLLNSSPSKICSQTGYFTSAIHAIIGLYNKFGNLLYDYKKCFLIRDIQILIKDIPVDEMEDTIQKLPSLFAYEYAIFTYIMDENRNGISIPRYMGIEGYFQFVIEDEKEGKKALENGWRNFKLWKLYRRLEVQGKLPVYKDKEVEENLWYAKKRPDWLYKDLDAVETINPMDETIAKNITNGVGGGSSILLAFHVYGVFEAATRFCVFDGLRGKVPKRVLSELFRNGLCLEEYIRNTIRSITEGYDKPSWWNLRYYNIPTVWEDWILVEWLFHKLKNSFKAMIKPRVYYIHGIRAEYTYFGRLDEIKLEDLTNGIKTSPSVAFRNSEARLRKVIMEENIELPISPFKETERVKQLKYSFDFIEESKFMHNCVSGYVNSAKDKRCFIYHVESNNQHSTMEINKYGEILQLYGPYNDEPETEVLYSVAEWLRINNLKVSEIIKEWRNTMSEEEKIHFDEIYSR